ncbi:MAG TPA: protein kinase, partial [Gammaproteobacteria bacterium]|nr:protein kinase [Gammaproteobacteria bacterium]
TPIERVNLLGTRNYCAPEYFRNQPGTTASDIYSLGIIAYELLTDRLPYGEMPRDAANPKFLQRLHYTPAVDRDPAIPKWVDGALRKAAHLEPKQRYSELSEFIHDLRHPNPAFANSAPRPLLERNPVAFWRGLAILLLFINLVLFYLLFL